jgi:hypothetical protein
MSEFRGHGFLESAFPEFNQIVMMLCIEITCKYTGYIYLFATIAISSL